MWASFGYFDAPSNRRVLAGFADRVRAGGRVLLDVYDRRFFEARQGSRTNRGVEERTTVRGDRLRAELRYPDGSRDAYEWQVFTPDELERAGAEAGLELLRASAGFVDDASPTGAAPRMQLLFERR